ncbi:MAG: hypothetical protein RLY86_1215 [Pseudomonadota bacterium]|jgi:glutamine synthetase
MRADPTEAEAFLGRHPEVEAVDIVLIDPNGIGRGKMIRRHELMALYRQGRHLPSSILGLDVAGEDVDATGLVWDMGDQDLRAWPVPGTLVPMPWTTPRRAQVLLSLCDLDGNPFHSDPSACLARQVRKAASHGLIAQAAFELEFYLLDREPGPDGRPQPCRRPLDGRRLTETQVYGLDDLDGLEPLTAALYAAAAAQDLPVETLISEYAPGQVELTLRYRTDLLRAADDLVMLKRLVRGVARRQGTEACFMAKPFGDRAGSGMHLHLSLTDRQGRNIFAEEPVVGRGGDMVPALRHAVGGLLATMPEAMLVFAPHANSWRRFVAQSYAPSAPTWGPNTRDVALRIPAGPPASRRIEHRMAGVDANPYLVGAVALGGILTGLEMKLDPGPPTLPGAEPVQGEGPPLPPDWRSAIAHAATSPFLEEVLGPGLHRTFLAVKQAEYARVAATVPDIDYRLYQHSV